MTESADKNFAQAQYLLGMLLYKGGVTEKDIPKALKYFESAAQSNDNAAYFVGKIYLTEQSVADAKKAISYFEMSAKAGNADAEYMLGKIYLFGKYAERDYDKAMAYLTAATGKENAPAINLLQYAEDSEKAFRQICIESGVARLFKYIAYAIQERTEGKSKGGAALTDRKLRSKIEEKKQAQGLKHE